MKKSQSIRRSFNRGIPCLFFIFGFSSTILASNYYWVDGTGAWSDYATHWATTSGGTVFHVTIPGPNDDVIFDANSFQLAFDTVYMGSTITNCHTMDWSAALNAPTFYRNGPNDLDIYGSLILNPTMSFNFTDGNLNFKAASGNYVLNTFGTQVGSSIYELYFLGAATWNLTSGFSTANIHLSSGVLRTHGYPVSCGIFDVYADLFLDTSHVTCGDWNADYASHLTQTIDADSSVIDCGFFGAGRGFTYNDITATIKMMFIDSCAFHDAWCSDIVASNSGFHNVFMTESANGFDFSGYLNKLIMKGTTCSIAGIFQADTLHFDTIGQNISIGNLCVATINNNLLIQSNPGFPTSIECNTGTGTISKPSDTICTDFIYLKNIHATGGAVYYAGDHSVDLGGNSGWYWLPCPPLPSIVSDDDQLDLVIAFPNPMNSAAQVIFSNPNHDTWSFLLKDVTGRIVSNEKRTSGNSVLIEKKSLNSGIYFYELKNEEGKTGKGKIVVE